MTDSRSTRELLDTLEYHANKAPILKELSRRSREFGYSSLGAWLAGRVAEKRAADRPTLRNELTEIANSGWDFSGTHFPFESAEFCSEEGNVLDKTEDELSSGQRGFLFAIRKHYRRWKYNQSA